MNERCAIVWQRIESLRRAAGSRVNLVPNSNEEDRVLLKRGYVSDEV